MNRNQCVPDLLRKESRSGGVIGPLSKEKLSKERIQWFLDAIIDIFTNVILPPE